MSEKLRAKCSLCLSAVKLPLPSKLWERASAIHALWCRTFSSYVREEYAEKCDYFSLKYIAREERR